MLGTAVWASFITYWPYNLTPTLNNYDFANFDPTRLVDVFHVGGDGGARRGDRHRDRVHRRLSRREDQGDAGWRALAHLLAMLPMAVPGLVLGLGYVFFVNAKWNPLGFLYGTLLVLVINSIAHFYTVAHITALTALKQIDPEFESVSASLKVPFWRTFGRVTVPICLPAILDIAVYMFVNALTTVSAVIFLYGAVDQARRDRHRAHGRGGCHGRRRRHGDHDRDHGARRQAAAAAARLARVRQAAELAPQIADQN